MISYILVTKDLVEYSSPTLIRLLEINAATPHDHEIILYCPESSIASAWTLELLRQYPNIRFVPDTAMKGSPTAFNEVLKHVRGKYVSYLLNNVLYPLNFLYVLEYLKNDFKNKTFKMVNLMWDGGPGLPVHNHDSEKEGHLWEAHLWTPVHITNTPYPVIPLPFIELDTIDRHLNGHIFHPAFKNHYPDHWLGFYVSRHEEYKPYNWVCPNVRYELSPYQRGMNTSTDKYDEGILRALTDNFTNEPNNYVPVLGNNQ